MVDCVFISDQSIEMFILNAKTEFKGNYEKVYTPV